MWFVNVLPTGKMKVKKMKHCMFSLNFLRKRYMSEARTFSEDFNYRIPVSAIKEKLEEVKVPFAEGYTCYKISHCTFCSSYKYDTSSSDNIDLFINKKTGNFLCHQCKMSGRWSTLDRIIKLSKNKFVQKEVDFLKNDCVSYDVSQMWQRTVSDCEDLCNLRDEKYRLIMKHFNLLHWSKEHIQELDVKFDRKGNILLFPMFCQDTIVGYKTLDTSGNSYTFPRADCPGFLSYKDKSSSSEVIVVADIRDFIALRPMNLPQQIVCLPYGVMTLPQNLLPLFELYDKIILWLGVRLGAWNSSIQFAKKLVEKRCFLIRPTESQMSAVVAVSNGENVKLIVSDAKPIWHQFVTTFSSLREDVLAEIQNVNEINGIPWSRFPMLNNILKGHRRGELTVLTGTTGCGKTTFLSEYSLDLAMKGVNTLWGSFEIKNSRLARTMLQQYSGTPLTADDLELFNFWADKFETLPIYFLTFHGQNSIMSVMNAVEHCSYTYDIAHVIIDNVQFMIDVTHDSKYLGRFWTQDCILQSFRKFATTNNCHVTLVIHPRKEMDGADLSMNSIFGTAKAAQEADNILIIQDRRSSTIRGRKYLQICKNRFTGDLGSIPLEFDKNSLSFAPKQNHFPAVSKKESFIVSNTEFPPKKENEGCPEDNGVSQEEESVTQKNVLTNS